MFDEVCHFVLMISGRRDKIWMKIYKILLSVSNGRRPQEGGDITLSSDLRFAGKLHIGICILIWSYPKTRDTKLEWQKILRSGKLSEYSI